MAGEERQSAERRDQYPDTAAMKAGSAMKQSYYTSAVSVNLATDKPEPEALFWRMRRLKIWSLHIQTGESYEESNRQFQNVCTAILKFLRLFTATEHFIYGLECKSPYSTDWMWQGPFSHPTEDGTPHGNIQMKKITSRMEAGIIIQGLHSLL